MKEARKLGNYVEALAGSKGLSVSDLGEILGCTENQVCSFLRGRAYASFSQMARLASKLGVTVEQLLSGGEDAHKLTAVRCMNDFQNIDNREKILDLIDDYLDIVDAVAGQQ